MQTKILGHTDEDIGVEVIDTEGVMHTVEVGWDGEVEHFVDQEDYPHKRENRTEEEQRIMSQVEVRAKYAAQREFEDADILEPMWDIPHIERGLEALSNYPLEDFHREFRDFYDALRDPGQFITHSDFDLDDILVLKVFRIDDRNRITDVNPVLVRHYTSPNDPDDYGPVPEFPADEEIAMCLPPLEFEDGYDFEEQFHQLVTKNLLCQIRDCYFHMGEAPPEEYLIKGIGKLNIHGDGVGDT